MKNNHRYNNKNYIPDLIRTFAIEAIIWHLVSAENTEAIEHVENLAREMNEYLNSNGFKEIHNLNSYATLAYDKDEYWLRTNGYSDILDELIQSMDIFSTLTAGKILRKQLATFSMEHK